MYVCSVLAQKVGTLNPTHKKASRAVINLSLPDKSYDAKKRKSNPSSSSTSPKTPSPARYVYATIVQTGLVLPSISYQSFLCWSRPRTSFNSLHFSPPDFAKNPSPFFATSFRGKTSTSLLKRRRSSGVMTFFCSPGLLGGCCSVCLPFCCRCVLFGCCCDDGDGCWLALDIEGWAAEAAALAAALMREGAAVDSVKRGAGKLVFLSMASTRRVKRRKRASARMSVDSRSIVPESSLTARRLVMARKT